MQHPAEITLHQYMENASNGKVSMSEATIKKVANDVADALRKQFGLGKKSDFKLRMSNVGRPTCQLWFEKNKADKAIPKPTTFIMNMMIGDIIEAIFKGLLKESNVKFKNTDRVKLKINDDMNISGSYDLIIDNSVDDIKSASDWSYKNKFESYEKLAENDSFGYVGQLAGYAKASGKRVGGWWVVNKANGQFKYVSASGINLDKEIHKIQETVKKVKENSFERCFKPVKETFRGRETGNTVLNPSCKFCAYRFDCWDTLVERPAVMSKAKQPPIAAYVKLKEEYING